MFIKHGMRGVDWRERVKANVDHFHDCQAMKMDHIKAARFIHDKGIHVLIEWDGYARQGERAQGLFALRCAPIQILHQEFLGTSGDKVELKRTADGRTFSIPLATLSAEDQANRPPDALTCSRSGSAR